MHTPLFPEQLDAAIQVAEQRFAQSTGGENVCNLARDGRVTGGVKYDEGRLVALVTLRRRLRSEADAAQALLADELAVWSRALAEQQQRTPPAIPWLAYRQGGVDALEQLRASA
jgi:hypothetical protein